MNDYKRALESARQRAHDAEDEALSEYHHFVMNCFGGCYVRAAAFAEERAAYFDAAAYEWLGKEV